MPTSTNLLPPTVAECRRVDAEVYEWLCSQGYRVIDLGEVIDTHDLYCPDYENGTRAVQTDTTRYRWNRLDRWNNAGSFMNGRELDTDRVTFIRKDPLLSHLSGTLVIRDASLSKALTELAKLEQSIADMNGSALHPYFVEFAERVVVQAEDILHVLKARIQEHKQKALLPEESCLSKT